MATQFLDEEDCGFVLSKLAVPLSELRRRANLLPHQNEAAAPNEPTAFRPIKLRMLQKGSTFLSFGQTEVTAHAYGPRTSKSSLALERCQISVTARGVPTIGPAVRDALSSVIQLHKYPRSVIRLRIDVESDDGGSLPIAIMAATLAVLSAGVEIFDLCCGTRVLFCDDGAVCVDPSASDEAAHNNAVLVSVAILPNLQQLAFCEISGKLSPAEGEAKVNEAINQARRIHPVLQQQLTNQVKLRNECANFSET